MNIKTLVRNVSVIYLIISVFWYIFQSSSFEITSNIVYNSISLFVLPAYFFPIILLLYIKKKILRFPLVFLYAIAFVLVFPTILLGSLFVHGDLNNGWRLVYESPIDEKTFLGIYRTTDLGALGGDDLAAAIVTPVFPWLIQREVLFFNIVEDFPGNGELPISISVDGKHLSIPSPNELYNQ